jgi:hypothetical protein
LIESRKEELTWATADGKPATVDRAMTVISLVLIAAVGLVGCANQTQQPVLQYTLQPAVLTTETNSFWSWAGDAATAVSPQGEYILLARHDLTGQRIVAAPTADPAGSSGLKEIEFRFAPSDWEGKPPPEYTPLGWISDTECVILSTGLQDGGPNAGRRGIGILIGDTSTGAAVEMAFVPLSEGWFVDAELFPDLSKMVLQAGSSVVVADFASRSATTVKDDMPSPGGTFMTAVSPDGSSLLYQRHESSDGVQHGIYLLDLEIGAEECVVPNDTAMNLYPSWSPDSSLFAAYTVKRKPESGRSSSPENELAADWGEYEIYLHDDGPARLGSSITVFDKSGRKAAAFAVEDKAVGMLKWSPDSKRLAFVSADAPAGSRGTHEQYVWDLEPEGVWIVDIPAGKPERVANLANTGSTGIYSVSIAAFDPESRGVFYQVTGEASNHSVWYASDTRTSLKEAGGAGAGEAVRVADGQWQSLDDGVPSFKGSIAAVIGDGSAVGKGSNMALWLLNSEQCRKVSEWTARTAFIAAHGSTTLVVTGSVTDNRYYVTTYRMLVPESSR